MLLTYPCVLIHYLLVNSEEGNYSSAALFFYTTLPDHLTTSAATLVQSGLNYLPVFKQNGLQKMVTQFEPRWKNVVANIFQW